MNNRFQPGSSQVGRFKLGLIAACIISVYIFQSRPDLVGTAASASIVQCRQFVCSFLCGHPPNQRSNLVAYGGHFAVRSVQHMLLG